VLTAADIIRLLDLKPHPEGGHYRQTFKDSRTLDGGRAASTAIYFLLARGERSHWHCVDAVEIWHWHAGAPLALEVATTERRERIMLGDTLAPASDRRASCRHTPGRQRARWVIGRSSAAPWRRASSSRHSSSPRPAGSRLRSATGYRQAASPD
jgi:hypothetical protein